MSVVPIKDLGKGGVIKDTSSINLPENVFTDALNVRFRNNSIETIPGESILFSLGSQQAEYGVHWYRPDGSFNVFAKDGNIIRKNSTGTESTLFNGAGGLYTGSVWQTATFGGGYAIIFNNGLTTPLYALYQGGAADSALQPFPGWNYLPGYTVTAAVIRSFNYTLVAANLVINTGSSITYAPSTIRISVQAAIGSFPSVWQPGLTTDTADEFEINSSSPILDMAELRGNMFIYSSTSIHMLAISNGVASVRPYANSYGVLAANCIVEFDGNHFVVDRKDIYVHNGSGKMESVAEGRIRDYFLNNLNQTYASKTFVVKNNRYKEIWVCFPSLTSTGKCDRALIYNYVGNTWTIRQLPNVVSMLSAPELLTGSFRYGKDTLLALGSRQQVLQVDSGYEMFDPVGSALGPYTSYVSRERISPADPFSDVYITAITPVLETSAAETVVNVTVTGQNVYDKPVDYANTSGRDMTPISPKNEHQGYRVEPRTSGRWLNFKILSNAFWRLSFLGLDMKTASRR